MRIIVAGRMKSGKTFYTINEVIMKLINTRKILVLSLFDHPDYAEIPKLELSKLASWCEKSHITNTRLLVCPDREELIKAVDIVRKHLNCIGTPPALVVFEDCTKWVKDDNERLNKIVANFLFASRNGNIDLLFQFHSLFDVPRDIGKNATEIVLFKTADELDSELKKKIGAAAYYKVKEAMPILDSKKLDEYYSVIIEVESD